jgi:hypothetical protein
LKSNLYLLIGLLGFLAACSPSTKITKIWTDPSWNQADTVLYKKVLVCCPLKDDSSRKIAEDKMAANIKKFDAIPYHIYVKITDIDQNAMEEKLIKDGFDGIILMRLVNFDKHIYYTPGTPYPEWYNLRYAKSGYYSEDKTFYVETNFYSLAQKKLIWSASTSTLNPTKLDKTLNEIIAAIKAELTKKGLIKQ